MTDFSDDLVRAGLADGPGPRGAERVVVGKDGQALYSLDHYAPNGFRSMP